MRAWNTAWGGLALAGLAVEVLAIVSCSPDGTLSQTLRRAMKTRAVRRSAFVAWATFAAWFPWHLRS